MDAALLIARLVLAAVFLIAALGKLADREASRRALLAFGVPAPLATLLPAIELAVAAGLVFGSTAWAAALAAAVLLGFFTSAISTALVRGARPECACFGRLRPGPASWGTVARNAVLIGVAGFVVIAGIEDTGPGVEDLGLVGDVALAAALLVAAQALLLTRERRRLLGRVGELEATIALPATHGTGELPVGGVAPDFSLPGLYGERLTLTSLRSAGRPVLLYFTDPGCGPCSALLPTVARWQQEHSAELTVAVISRGAAADNRARCREHGVVDVLLQRDREVAGAYRATAGPSAVLVRADGTVASPPAFGGEAIRALAGGALSAPPASLVAAWPLEGPPIGRMAPELELEDLDGRPFSLLDLEGRRVLVLFWDPSCGFCAQMLSDLAAWAGDPPAGAPELVVVSRGSIASNRALGLAATVLVDADWSASWSFGASGTPMGLLVDEEGRIASGIAAGAPAIFELLMLETAS
jgi:thiol-disulfide isomerase/thioredoxin/uncharacterized membrane protein YphA (DoxX/SURF4 family)